MVGSFAHFTKRRQGAEVDDLPYFEVPLNIVVDDQFIYTDVPPFPVADEIVRSTSKAETRAFEAVVHTFVALADAQSDIAAGHQSRLLDRIVYVCYEYVKGRLPVAEPIWRACWEIVRKALGYPLVGKAAGLSAAMSRFAKYVLKSDDMPIRTRKLSKDVESDVKAKKTGTKKAFRTPEELALAMKVALTFADALDVSIEELCYNAQRITCIGPLYDSQWSSTRFCEYFFVLGFLISEHIHRNNTFMREWIAPLLLVGGKAPDGSKKTGFNFESVRVARRWAKIFSLCRVNPETQADILSYAPGKQRMPAYRLMWTLTHLNDIYPHSAESLRQACKDYFKGDSPHRAIDAILPRHRWTNKDEDAMIGHYKNMFLEQYGEALAGDDEDGEDGEIVVERGDKLELLARLTSSPAVDVLGDVINETPAIKYLTKSAIFNRFQGALLLLAYKALKAPVPLEYCFSPQQVAKLNEVGVVSGMDPDEAKPLLRELKAKLDVKNKEAKGSDDEEDGREDGSAGSGMEEDE